MPPAKTQKTQKTQKTHKKEKSKTRKSSASPCYAGIILTKEAIVTGIVVPYPHKKGLYTVAMFKDGLDYVSPNPFTAADAIKFKNALFSRNPHAYRWDEKTPSELEQISKKLGYKPPYRANLLKKLTDEVAFLETQMKNKACA